MMKRETFLHIPQPCHENWDNMTPVERGRYCDSCAKAVIDFSGMSDEQVLRVLSKAPGKLCGRFQDDQLERALQEPAPSKRPLKIFLAALIPAFLASAVANAQQHSKSRRSQPVSSIHRAMGFLVPKETITAEGQKTICGVVLNEEQQPVPFATISVNNKGLVAADSLGRFTVSIPSTNTPRLSISAVGYETKVVDDFSNTSDIVINLKKNVVLPDVVVSTGYNLGSIRMGGISRFRRVTHWNVRKSALWSRVSDEGFKAYPNPVTQGGEINVVFRKAGNYALQLIDNNGRLYLHKDVEIVSDKQQVSLTIPAEVAAGNYFLRAAYGKKQFVVKMLVK